MVRKALRLTEFLHEARPRDDNGAEGRKTQRWGERGRKTPLTGQPMISQDNKRGLKPESCSKCPTISPSYGERKCEGTAVQIIH